MVKKASLSIIATLLVFSVFSCKKEVLPKPSSQLRLDYPSAQYAHFENDCPFTFDINAAAIIKELQFHD